MPPIMLVSQRRGLLALTIAAKAGSRRSCSAPPKTIAAMFRQSLATLRPWAAWATTLSARVKIARPRSRWRCCTGTSWGSVTWLSTTCRGGQSWMSLTRSCTSARVPGRRPRSRSLTKAVPLVETKTVRLPPIWTEWAGLRARRVNSLGALATISSSRPRSIQTCWAAWSTFAPACSQIERASSSRKSMPISSRMRIEASWISSSCSALSNSVGGSGFSSTRKGRLSSGERRRCTRLAARRSEAVTGDGPFVRRPAASSCGSEKSFANSDQRPGTDDQGRAPARAVGRWSLVLGRTRAGTSGQQC